MAFRSSDCFWVYTLRSHIKILSKKYFYTAVFEYFVPQKCNSYLYSSHSIIVADELTYLIFPGFKGRKLQYDLQWSTKFQTFLSYLKLDVGRRTIKRGHHCTLRRLLIVLFEFPWLNSNRNISEIPTRDSWRINCICRSRRCTTITTTCQLLLLLLLLLLRLQIVVILVVAAIVVVELCVTTSEIN